MFKQLRNKFLMLNLVIISVMMLVSFTVIYLITYNDVTREINAELHKVSEFNQKSNDRPRDKEPRQDFNGDSVPPERSVAFTIITDSNGVISDTISMLSADKEYYESAKLEALSQKSDIGKLKLEGNYWAFIIKPFNGGYRMVFVDITSRQAILINLIYTFLLVALLMIIAIFFISRFFANRSIKPIKDAFERQKQFVEDASHELKTPLAVINTNVDVLLSNQEDTIKNQAKWLSYIKSEVERMTKLTKDLLYLTQVDYSDTNLVSTSFNMSDTVENMILTMEAVVFENNISLDYEIEPNLKLYGNLEQIKQVIMILLDNALKYTNPKGRVELKLKRLGNNMLLSVTNTGKGIPEENLEKIFDRFYRVDKSRSRNSGGYGLGLSIAKAIVEQHKGRIWARSIPEESTTFFVELPNQ